MTDIRRERIPLVWSSARQGRRPKVLVVNMRLGGGGGGGRG